MALITSVGNPRAGLSTTTPDLGPVFEPAFPSADLVEAAAGLFTRHRHPERAVRVTPDGLLSPSDRKSADLFGADPRRIFNDRELIEGPRWSVTIAPGCVSVRSTDPARAERTANRQADAHDPRRGVYDGPTCPVGSCVHDSCGALRTLRADLSSDAAGSRAVVTAWSRKSRARMVETLSSLDYAPMFAGGGVPAMLTLTYPGDWLAVAPDSATCHAHLRALAKRFRRAWGVPLVAVWKREFQRRGAPHYHLLMVPPHGTVGGLAFRDWVSQAWADVVGSQRCTAAEPVRRAFIGPLPAGKRRRVLIACCEWHRHRESGTGVDYAEGLRARDPKRLGVYFSKHGSFSAKDYQNVAPVEWEGQSVGRFWGVWGLEVASAAVEIAPAEALAAVRVLRRYSRANRNTRPVPYGTRGTLRTPARSRHRLMSYGAGYLVVNNGPAVASGLATALDRLYRPESIIGRSGAGPLGYLP